jgi:probable HAF family extracellular repeat protein
LGGERPQSHAYGVSDNGVVVGFSKSNSGREAFSWTKSGGMVGIGYLPAAAAYSDARGVSSDGNVIIGIARSLASEASGNPYEAFRWTQSMSMQGLGDLPGGNYESSSNACSADGSTIVGMSISGIGYEAFRWTEDDGIVGLGHLPDGVFSGATGVSADGTVIVGYSESGSESAYEAFRWTEAGDMQGLGDLPGGGFYSDAAAISADGTTIIGYSDSGLGTGYEAFRWTQADGMQGLGSLGSQSFLWAISGDGSVVVGENQDGALVWDAIGGVRNLESVLESYGVVTNGWTLSQATDVSHDGLTIVGYGINPDGNKEAWIATIPEPATLGVLALGGLAVLRRRRRC